MSKIDPATQLRRACETAFEAYVESGRAIVQDIFSLEQERRSSRNKRTKTACLQPEATGRKKRRASPKKEERKIILLATVAEHPGEPLTTLSCILGTPISHLRTAMADLVASGQVARIGERSLTRYFPVAESYVADSLDDGNIDGAGFPAKQAATQPSR